MTEQTNTMKDNGFVSNLDATLKALGDNVTRNALAVEAKIRPLTVNALYSEKAKQINFATLKEILDALDRIAAEKGIDKKHTVTDIFERKSTD
jgi:DNA-binding Xre family transcriptional regulator